MSTPRTNILLATNTSGVPGIRARWRTNRYGRRSLELDVSWQEGARRRFTSYPVGDKPLQAVERAMGRRVAETGVPYPFSARAAWRRLKLQAQAGAAR